MATLRTLKRKAQVALDRANKATSQALRPSSTAAEMELARDAQEYARQALAAYQAAKPAATGL